LEEGLRLELPADLRASLKRHDGQWWRIPRQTRNAPPLFWHRDVYRLLTVSEIAEEARGWASIAESDPVPEGFWDNHQIPLAKAGTGDLITVDARTGALTLSSHDEEKRPRVLKGFGTWLARFADELEAGRFEPEDDFFLKRTR
jgi:cell wall assembly regulator SMI1